MNIYGEFSALILGVQIACVVVIIVATFKLITSRKK